jgi:hypothetical protein
MEYFKTDNNDHSISFKNQNEAKCIKLVKKEEKIDMLFIVSINYLQFKL